MNTNAREVLTAARDAITATEGKNLIVGNLVRVRYDGTICHCALGYIAKADGFSINTDNDGYAYFSADEHNLEEDEENVYVALNDHPATKALAHAISQFGVNLPRPVSTVYRYNDDKVNRHDYHAVVKAFDTAIELLKD